MNHQLNYQGLQGREPPILLRWRWRWEGQGEVTAQQLGGWEVGGGSSGQWAQREQRPGGEGSKETRAQEA